MLTFKILGPLEVVRNGESIPLGPAKQRAFLACLLLHQGETVSIDRLSDELWGQQAPPRADRNLHQYVFRLRKVLSQEGRAVLVTRPLGYQLELAPDDVVDALRFEALVRSARDVLRRDPTEALELLERGLALWRGPALADFTYEGFAETAIRRLEELRAGAEEARIETLLALGRESDAIPEVEALVQRFPLRERVRALQMLALYRAGRQSEALGAFQAARQALASELGIDPGPELTKLEEAILRHDPDLQLPSVVERVEGPEVDGRAGLDGRTGVTSIDHEGEAPGLRRRRGRGVVFGGTIVLVAIVTVIAAIALRDEPTPPHEPSGGPIGDAQGSEGLLLDWREASSSDFVEPGSQRVLGGVRTPSGFVIFGYTAAEGENVGDPKDYDMAVWSGTPERGWTAVRSRSFSGESNQRATDAAVFKDGEVVLVGSDQPTGDFDAAAWFRPSGSNEWVRADVRDPGLNKEQDQKIRDAVRSGEQLFAVGSTESTRDEEPAVWRSQRGIHWTYQQGAVRPKRGLQEMSSIALGGGLLVAGGSAEVDGERDAAVWTWKATSSRVRRAHDDDLGGFGDQQINAITAGGPGFVAVGEETIDGDVNAAVWTSADGRAWERAADPAGVFAGEGAQQMFSIAASPIGLVAAGSDRLLAGTDAREPEGHWDAAVWTSRDGLIWERLPGDDLSMTTLTDLGDQEIKALIPTDDGFLALGAEAVQESEWDARVWIGERIP